MRYLTTPDIYFTDGSINSPSCPTALDMLKVASTLATARLRTDIAIWLPGHILVDHLSPSSSRHGQWKNITFDQTRMPSMQGLGRLDQAGRSSDIVLVWKMMDRDSQLRYEASPWIEKAASLAIISDCESSRSYQAFPITIVPFGMK